MKTQILSFLLCAFILNSWAQDFQVKNVEERNPHFPENLYTFPIIEGSNDSVTRKINAYLVKEQLDIDYGQEETSIFENVWQKPGHPVARINYLTYQVELLNDKLYAVTISGEFCSAYCEGYNRSYTFDLNTGNLLTLDTLFNKPGQEKLLDELVNHKRQLITQQITKIERTMQSDTLQSDELSYYQEMLDLYLHCNSEYDKLMGFRFIPSQDSIQIIFGRCSTHVNRNVDELWAFQKQISIEKWTPHLSKTGREKLIP